MPVEICLMIQEDGQMFVKTEQADDTDTGDMGTPVKSIDEACAAIKQMASEASIAQPDEMMQEEQQGQPQPDQGAEEEAAMMGSYNGYGANR